MSSRPAPRSRALGAAALLLVVSSLLWPGRATGYGDVAVLDLNHFHIAPGTQRLLGTDLGRVGKPLEISVQSAVYYADQSLILASGQEKLATLVGHRVLIDTSFSLSLGQWLQLALTLPAVPYQRSDMGSIREYPHREVLQNPIAAHGVGDLRVHAKIEFPLARYPVPGGFAVEGTLVLPSGDGNSFLGTTVPSFIPRVIGHVELGPAIVALNIGWRVARSERFLEVSQGAALTYSLGTQLELFAHSAAVGYLVGEVYGYSDFWARKWVGYPLEYVIAAKTKVRNVEFLVGAGSSIHSAIGTPKVRGFISLNVAFEPLEPAVRPQRPPTRATQDTCKNVEERLLQPAG